VSCPAFSGQCARGQKTQGARDRGAVHVSSEAAVLQTGDHKALTCGDSALGPELGTYWA
jgi:hypothetical protein